MVDLGFTAKEYALLIPILTVCLVILIVTITFMVKKLKPKKITKDGITFEEDSPVSPHKQCGHGRDWVQILAEHVGIYNPSAGTWQTGNGQCSGLIISDGVNYRLHNSESVPLAVYYRKLA